MHATGLISLFHNPRLLTLETKGSAPLYLCGCVTLKDSVHSERLRSSNGNPIVANIQAAGSGTAADAGEDGTPKP